jgi:hypothetical protein
MGGDAEGHGGSPVEVGVEDHQDVLGLSDRVATRERRLDLRGADARHAGADVEAVAVEDEPDVGGVARRRAFGRFLLCEVGHRDGAEPDFFVQPAVEANAALGHAHRPRLFAIAGRCLSGGEGRHTQHRSEDENPGAGQ